MRILSSANWGDKIDTTSFANQTAGASWLQFALIAKQHGTAEEVKLALSKAENNLSAAINRIAGYNKQKVLENGELDLSKMGRVDLLGISLSEVYRAQGRPGEAADLLETHLAPNELNGAYLEALGFALIEAGRAERGESFLYQSLLLDDSNRELSRAIHTWMLTGAVPPQRRALATAEDKLQMELAPPLNIEDPRVIERLRAAEVIVAKALDKQKRPLEKARMQRTLRMMLRKYD